MSRPGSDDAGPSNWQAIPAVPRVSQVDAEDLDAALVGMLSERLEKSLGTITVRYAFSDLTKVAWLTLCPV